MKKNYSSKNHLQKLIILLSLQKIKQLVADSIINELVWNQKVVGIF